MECQCLCGQLGRYVFVLSIVEGDSKDDRYPAVYTFDSFVSDSTFSLFFLFLGCFDHTH